MSMKIGKNGLFYYIFDIVVTNFINTIMGDKEITIRP